MSFPKLLAIVAVVLFGIIGIAVLFKGDKGAPISIEAAAGAPLEVELDQELRMVSSPEPAAAHIESAFSPSSSPSPSSSSSSTPSSSSSLALGQSHLAAGASDASFQEVDRIAELFNKSDPKLPIVETITYHSRVSWQKGRPAWLSDYASHYSTSRHFIARSLNGRTDYLKQDVAEGDRFNVLRPGKKISFHLLIDTSRSKMWFYYVDGDANERVLLKTYNVGLGRFDSSKPSGMLTPLGKYSLGDKIAIYKPKVSGFYDGKKIEMIRVFGTRWIPFDKELGECSAPAAGFGIHGVPWVENDKGELIENLESLGKYESDGCIRLATSDIEEIFAIIITRPAVVELVKDFYSAKLSSVEINKL